MELRHLRYFLAIAEHSHFGVAAEELLVSQPTLSQQMKELEAELEIQLFERVGRGVKLSQAGELYREVARQALNVLEEGEALLHEFDHLLRGSLTIGVVQTVNAYLIPAVVAQFIREFPKVRLRIEELAASEIEDRLMKATLDLGLSFSPTSGSELECESLFEEELVLAVHPSHHCSQRKKIGLAALTTEPLSLLPRGYCTRRIIEESFRQASATLSVAVELNSIAALLAIVRAGGPPTIVPKLGIDSSTVKMVRLERPTPKRQVCILSSKTKPNLRTRHICRDVAESQK